MNVEWLVGIDAMEIDFIGSSEGGPFFMRIGHRTLNIEHFPDDNLQKYIPEAHVQYSIRYVQCLLKSPGFLQGLACR
jgi:hypothetical protein